MTAEVCVLCGTEAELHEQHCAPCTFAEQLAPDLLANLLGLRMGSVVELDGTSIDLGSALAVGLLTRKLSERYRRLGAAGLFDWAGAVTFSGAMATGAGKA